MSGGSWDYLFRDDNASRDQIRAMARRLEEIAPGSPAARDTRLLANLLFDERLRETWRALEWEDSGDGHEGEVAEAIAAHGDLRAAQEAMTSSQEKIPHEEILPEVVEMTAEEEAAYWRDHAQNGVDTPGCDCGHDGMGVAWHASSCAWKIAR